MSFQVLIISTDPAHSLGDALGCKLSAWSSGRGGLESHQLVEKLCKHGMPWLWAQCDSVVLLFYQIHWASMHLRT